MKKLTLLALCCFLLAVGCQDQPSSSGTSSSSTPAVETPAPAEVQPEATPAAGEETEAAADAPAVPLDAEALQGKLAHHNFVISLVDGQEFVVKLPEGAEGQTRPRPNISFGEWPFAGGKICNNYRGQVEVEGGKLFLKNAASTMMLCGDSGLNELESLLYQMLEKGVEVSFGEDGSLTLTGDEHELTFELSDYVN